MLVVLNRMFTKRTMVLLGVTMGVWCLGKGYSFQVYINTLFGLSLCDDIPRAIVGDPRSKELFATQAFCYAVYLHKGYPCLTTPQSKLLP